MTYHLKSFFPTRNRKLVLCPTDDFFASYKTVRKGGHSQTGTRSRHGGNGREERQSPRDIAASRGTRSHHREHYERDTREARRTHSWQGEYARNIRASATDSSSRNNTIRSSEYGYEVPDDTGASNPNLHYYDSLKSRQSHVYLQLYN